MNTHGPRGPPAAAEPVVSCALKCNLQTINLSHNLCPNKTLGGVKEGAPTPIPTSTGTKTEPKPTRVDADHHVSTGDHRHQQHLVQLLHTTATNRHVIRDNALLLSAPIWINSSQRNDLQHRSLREREDEGLGDDWLVGTTGKRWGWDGGGL